MSDKHHGRSSRRLTKEDAIQIWLMIWDGWLQSRIAAHFDVNGGRISEVHTGKKFPEAYQLALQRRRVA